MDSALTDMICSNGTEYDLSDVVALIIRYEVAVLFHLVTRISLCNFSVSGRCRAFTRPWRNMPRAQGPMEQAQACTCSTDQFELRQPRTPLVF